MTAIELSESTYVLRTVKLRHHLDDRGESWFIGKEVCEFLELSDTSSALRKVWPEYKGRELLPTPGGAQEMLTVNELGLYQLIFMSKHPDAVAFQKAVYEMLRTARRQGYYVIPGRQLRVGPGTGKAAHGRQPFLDVIRSRGLSAARALAGMNALDLPVPQVRETTYGNQTYGSCRVSVALATRASTYLNLPVEELFTPSSRANLTDGG